MASRNKVSLATAKIVPAFLTLIVGYMVYVLLGPLCLDYLINAPDDVPTRIDAGIAIMIVGVLLLIPVVASWLRLLLVVVGDPGYTPLGDPKWTEMDIAARSGLEQFYEKDVFACDYRGLPRWCDQCHNWKPDRTHHNQDVGRCTLKMDHFCPWVGGVVGERSFKFFVQFLSYSLLASTFVMILLAYFVHETRRDVQWMIALGLASFFVLFTLGTVINSIWMTFRNVTSIENIDTNPNGKSQFFAVILPPELQGIPNVAPPRPAQKSFLSRSDSGEGRDIPEESELDDPSHTSYFSSDRSSRRAKQSEHWRGTITYPLMPPMDRPPLPAPVPRTYAILETTRGSNPWDLGSPWLNFTAVFGPKLHHWLLPVRHSPCCDHTSTISQYPLGVSFEQLLFDTGLVHSRAAAKAWETSAVSHKKKRRKRRLPEGWENGERPPGWDAQKAARRLQHEEERRRWKEEQQRSSVS